MNKRRQYFIDKRFQSRFIIRFSLIVFASSLFVMAAVLLFSNNSTTVAIENTRVVVKRTSDFIFPLVVQAIAIAAFFSSLSVIVLTLLMTHKIAGPLYRISKELEKMQEGSLDVNFNTRAYDQLKSLSSSLNKVQDVFSRKLSGLKQEASRLSGYIKSNNIQKAEESVKRLQDMLEFFK